MKKVLNATEPVGFKMVDMVNFMLSVFDHNKKSPSV